MTGFELKEAKEELEFVKDRFYDFPKEINATNSINNVQNAIKAINELEDYYAIGTVEECREARERQRVKKVMVMVVRARNEKESVSTGDYVHYKCPNCEKKIGSAFHYPFNEYMMEHKFCNECGQKLDWSDNNDLNS